jgi:hypothetical protein
MDHLLPGLYFIQADSVNPLFVHRVATRGGTWGFFLLLRVLDVSPHRHRQLPGLYRVLN